MLNLSHRLGFAIFSALVLVQGSASLASAQSNNLEVLVREARISAGRSEIGDYEAREAQRAAVVSAQSASTGVVVAAAGNTPIQVVQPQTLSIIEQHQQLFPPTGDR